MFATWGIANGKPSVIVTINRQPGANIIDTVDRIRDALPQLKAAIPHSIQMNVTQDQTVTIRASVRDIERTMSSRSLLVILVVFVFLRSLRTTFIPSVAVPVSLIGTFGVMYLFGYSLDNLSLMALTISTGFVVDDAIVVIENITRYLEQGMTPFAAALRGRAGDRVHGAHHQHFADRRVHSAAADGRHRGPAVPRIRGDAVRGDRDFDGGFAHHHAHDVRASAQASIGTHGWLYRTSERAFNWMVELYGRTLDRVLRHPCHHAGGAGGHHRAERLSVHSRAQGIFPAAGQRPAERDDHGRPGHLLPGHGSNPAADGEDRQGRIRRWIRWPDTPAAAAARKHHQHGAHAHPVEAARPNARSRYTTSSSGCVPSSASFAGSTPYCRPTRTCAWAAAAAHRCISSPCAATTCRT